MRMVLKLFRRYVVLVALMFWMGGFTFYTAVVVPEGTRVLGSPLRQGFITREVTWWLNVSGAVALAILAADVILTHDPSRLRRMSRGTLILLMAGCQGFLFWLWEWLNAMLDPVARTVTSGDFYNAHRVYLW